jgi:hypothetical protein
MTLRLNGITDWTMAFWTGQWPYDWTMALLWTGQWPYGLDNGLMNWAMALETGKRPYGLDNSLMDWTMALWTG